MTSKSISLIVPAYKEEKTIIKQVKEIKNALKKISSDFEIIVVVDGFNDNTFKEAQKIKTADFKLFGYKKNKGKGYAIKYGVEKASKEIVGFMDAGMDLNPKEISTMLSVMNKNNADIVVGSKVHPKSRIKYPFFRKVLSKGYRFIIQMLFDLKIKDTQAGFKLFKKEIAKKIFSKITINGFAFDIESLVIAKKLGYVKIFEAPINVNLKKSSINYFNFINVAFWMFIDTINIFVRYRLGNAVFNKKN